MDMQKNIQEAKDALEQKPLYSATYERIFILNEIKSKYNHLKQPLRFAAVLGELLERVSLPLADYDLIAGRSLDRVLTDEEEALLREYVNAKDNPERETLLNSGHCTFSWESLVRLGLSGLLSRTEEKLAAEQDPTKRVFLEGMCGVYRALSRFALRYAKAAEKKGMTSLAQTLSAIAHRAPDSFREGLQLLWLVTFVDCSYISSNPTLTVGRLDVALYPLYQRDMERGTLTPLLAKAYITDYYCKHNLNMGRGEHQVGTAETTTSWERILNYDAPQYLLLGGTDEKGKSAVNDLTLLFAECICPAFKNPVVVVRYHKGMAKEHPLLWDVICQKGLASASMMIYNDDNVIEAFRKIGLPQDVCRQYSHFGCNWASAGERSSWMCSAPKSFLYCPDMDKEERVALNVPYMRTNAACSYPQDVVEIMEELCREEKECSIEDFYSRFLSRLDDFLDRKLAYLSHELSARQRAPSSLLSYADCFLDESFQNAACHSAGATYHFELQSFQMFGTVVDCFTVIDTLVFKDKKVT
ncbi:MAG: hypothetical protein J6K61_01465, partial [Clostridia bacterium]|nr:hypothetical protein [Clostridia bacterium]